MEDKQERLGKWERWYSLLNKFLLNLLLFELGYLILLMVLGIVLLISILLAEDLVSELFDIAGGDATFLLWPFLIYLLALPLNLGGGFASLLLHRIIDQEGYPGTGHLLNWVFLMSTGWMFIPAIYAPLMGFTVGD